MNVHPIQPSDRVLCLRILGTNSFENFDNLSMALMESIVGICTTEFVEWEARVLIDDWCG